MSDIVNTNLFERASYCIDQLESHPGGIDKRIAQAIDNNDLDDLAYLVSIGEGILAQEEFEAGDIV